MKYLIGIIVLAFAFLTITNAYSQDATFTDFMGTGDAEVSTQPGDDPVSPADFEPDYVIFDEPKGIDIGGTGEVSPIGATGPKGWMDWTEGDTELPDMSVAPTEPVEPGGEIGTTGPKGWMDWTEGDTELPDMSVTPEPGVPAEDVTITGPMPGAPRPEAERRWWVPGGRWPWERGISTAPTEPADPGKAGEIGISDAAFIAAIERLIDKAGWHYLSIRPSSEGPPLIVLNDEELSWWRDEGGRLPGANMKLPSGVIRDSDYISVEDLDPIEVAVVNRIVGDEYTVHGASQGPMPAGTPYLYFDYAKPVTWRIGRYDPTDDVDKFAYNIGLVSTERPGYGYVLRVSSGDVMQPGVQTILGGICGSHSRPPSEGPSLIVLNDEELSWWRDEGGRLPGANMKLPSGVIRDSDYISVEDLDPIEVAVVNRIVGDEYTVHGASQGPMPAGTPYLYFDYAKPVTWRIRRYDFTDDVDKFAYNIGLVSTERPGYGYVLRVSSGDVMQPGVQTILGGICGSR